MSSSLIRLSFFTVMSVTLVLVLNFGVCNPRETASEPEPPPTPSPYDMAALASLTAPWLAECLLSEVDRYRPVSSSELAGMRCISDPDVRRRLEAVPAEVWDDRDCLNDMYQEWNDAGLHGSGFLENNDYPRYYYRYFMCYAR